jgi:hypothetical protein
VALLLLRDVLLLHAVLVAGASCLQTNSLFLLLLPLLQVYLRLHGLYDVLVVL